MFEKQVEERLALLKPDVEEKVALGVGKVGVDEGAGLKGEGTPVECNGEFWREVVFQKSACVFRDGKGGFEQCVVGLVKALFGHGRE
jgi:hypothetical protein